MSTFWFTLFFCELSDACVPVTDYLQRNDDWLRMCVLFFLFAIPMQLLVVFSGELTSSMAIRDPEDHIRTLEDVLRFKNIRIYGEAKSSLSLMFLVGYKPIVVITVITTQTLIIYYTLCTATYVAPVPQTGCPTFTCDRLIHRETKLLSSSRRG